MFENIPLILGSIVLIVGVILGSAGDDDKRGFAVWLTIIGTGLMAWGLVIAHTMWYVPLIVGIIVLVVGIAIGIFADSDKRGFAVWLTIVGLVFIVWGLVQKYVFSSIY
jgi:hypothetical protein